MLRAMAKAGPRVINNHEKVWVRRSTFISQIYKDKSKAPRCRYTAQPQLSFTPTRQFTDLHRRTDDTRRSENSGSTGFHRILLLLC